MKWSIFVALLACKHAADDPCAQLAAKDEGPLRWVVDDYAGAVACAKPRERPVVVDLWAPWCHTCLSMQSTVFMDPSFAADRDRFVFVALDTDREVNAPALQKMSLSAWPTFYVIDPTTEQVLGRWIGAASVQQFHELLDVSAKARAGGVAAADARLLSANRALAEKDYASAQIDLNAALLEAPANWSRKPELLGDLILTDAKREDYAGCMALAEGHMGETGNAAVASDFLVTATSCAEQRAEDEPDRVRALREHAVARWRELLADANAPLSTDDRSDAMASLRETLDALERHDEAKQVAEAQRALLDKVASLAKDPMAAMTYNWPRAEVYVYLGRPLDLVPALEKSARDLPKEYDPRARLGWIYWKAGKLDLAAQWTDEALAMVYGPRKGRLLTQRAEIAKAAGDSAAERRYREDTVKLWESLPASQQSPDALAKAKALIKPR